MRKRLKKYGLIFSASIQNNLAYWVNFLLSNIFFVLIIYVFINLWKAIYASGIDSTGMEGYSYNQIIWYFIIAEIVILARGNVFINLSRDVKDGSIAYQLNKPYSYLAYYFSDSMGYSSVKLILNAIVGIAAGLLLIGPMKTFIPAALPLQIMSLICGMLIQFFTYACLGMTAFWVEENKAFFWIYSKLAMVCGMFMPIELFPDWLERIVRFLPFPYITYAPAKLIVDFSMETFYNVFPIQLLYLTISIALSMHIYKKGVRILNVNGG